MKKEKQAISIGKRELLIELVFQKLCRISDILQNKYGVDNSKGINVQDNDYQIYIVDALGNNLCFQSYNAEDLVSINVEGEAEYLRKEYVAWYC